MPRDSWEHVGIARPISSAEVEFIGREAHAAWEWLETIVADVTEDQANWQPPGTANSIGATYLHVVINPDVELNRLLYGRDPIIEARWAGDVGQGFPYDADRFDDWVSGALVDWVRLREYGRAVHVALVESLAALTPEDLDCSVDMSRAGLGDWQGRDLYLLHGWRHVYMHGGEIACLKGLLGATGYLAPTDRPRPSDPV